MTDEKNLERYPKILEGWLRRFVKTMNDDGDLQAGDDSGETPFGTKIIFESYAEDDDENPIKSSLTFTMFVHKDSLTKKFKEHVNFKSAYVGILQIRPKEECIINGFYDKKTDEVEVPTMIEDETENCTELDRNFVIDLICKIDERDKK